MTAVIVILTIILCSFMLAVAVGFMLSGRKKEEEQVEKADPVNTEIALDLTETVLTPREEVEALRALAVLTSMHGYEHVLIINGEQVIQLTLKECARLIHDMEKEQGMQMIREALKGGRK